MTSKIFVDVAQFVSNPVTTGIQRTLLFLARHWPPDGPVVEFGFLPTSASHYSIVPLNSFREAAEWVFGNRGPRAPRNSNPSRELTQRLDGHAICQIAPQSIPETYDGYLLPEVTFQDRILDSLALCASSMGRRCMAIVFDPLPQTHPHVFRGPHQGPTTRYFLTLTSLDSLAFISPWTHREFERRLRRSRVPNPIDIPLGADALGREVRPAPSPPIFVVAATVEPRKRHDLVLDAFDRLWRQGHQYRLLFLGVAGWAPESFIRRLRQRAKQGDLFGWNEHVSDAELRDALASASGAIFVSELEGYGLPPLEALALGCPVVVPANLPSLEGLEPYGQIRLEAVTEDAVAAAVSRIADPTVNSELRRAIQRLELPTWPGVIEHFASWVHATIEGAGSRRDILDGGRHPPVRSEHEERS